MPCASDGDWAPGGAHKDLADPPPLVVTPPSTAEAERDWAIIFSESFQNNIRNWGFGYKDDGVSRIERTMQEGQYVLEAHNRFHDTILMGGDSSCFAPPIYYLTAEAQLARGNTEDDGYALVFEEIGDNCLAMFRIRDRSRLASVI